MSDDQPQAATNGGPHGPSATGGTNGDGGVAPLEPELVAATMMRQLTDLLSAWETQALILAERGVDPRPLLGQLAGNLRAVADQLDGGA